VADVGRRRKQALDHARAHLGEHAFGSIWHESHRLALDEVLSCTSVIVEEA